MESGASGLPPRFNLFLEHILFAIFTYQFFHSKRRVLSLIIVAIQALVAKVSRTVKPTDDAKVCLLHGHYDDLGVS